jgi:protocatechuate 3,4-dioxygenase beta subunit
MQRSIILIVLSAIISSGGCSQNNTKPTDQQSDRKEIKVGAPCEGCEGIYEQAPSFENLSWTDTLPDFNEPGPKLVISGIIYKVDGTTPAPGIVLYVYHTDQKGLYTPGNGQTGRARRHGYIRGWIKTNKKGEYKFYTLKPAAYPGHNIPAHIHPIIKEPGKNEYWIDEYLFDDDPLLTAPERKKQPGVGGNGVIALEEKNGILYGERNIYLGRNVDNYPQAKLTGLQSGLNLGDNCPAFDPLHLSGADSGKKTCPMCKYGYGQGVMIWFNHANLEQMNQFVNTMETEMIARGEKKLRVFMIYMNPFYKENSSDEETKNIQKKIREWCEERQLKKVAVTWIPSPVDPKTAGLYKINPTAKNTVLVYKKRKLAAKWVNMKYSNESANDILKKI